MKTKIECIKFITYLNERAITNFNEAIMRLQTNGKEFTWVAETIIKTSFKKDFYGRMLIALHEQSTDVVIKSFVDQLKKQHYISKSSCQFDMIEGVFQLETKYEILSEFKHL